LNGGEEGGVIGAGGRNSKLPSMSSACKMSAAGMTIILAATARNKVEMKALFSSVDANKDGVLSQVSIVSIQ